MKPIYRHAIVRKPARSMVHGLSATDMGTPNYERAMHQHAAYVKALQSCGLEVEVLEADEEHPDSCFVEDVALLTPSLAILTNPGAPTRKGETKKIMDVVAKYYDAVERINEPATIEAGDVMMVGSHFYIGISERTNLAGATQLIGILETHGMTGQTVMLDLFLHLKTGLAYLEHNNLLISGEFVDKPLFTSFNRIEVGEQESYAANCIWVNEKVLIPKGFSETKSKIKQLNYPIVELEMSEFQKLDGGLSCLSLRF